MAINLALTFDDVLLKPKRSGVSSRKQIQTDSLLTPKINLSVPIISANMDTVTEADMAIAMATIGGIGIIHRFLSMEAEVKQVETVKRWLNFVIDDPFTVSPDTKISQVQNMVESYGVSGIIVVDKQNKPLGIVSKRDLLPSDPDQLVTEVMTPKSRLVTAPAGINLEAAKKLLHKHRFEKLPLVDAKGRLVGLVTLRDIQNLDKFPHASKDHKGRLRVGAAVGVGPDTMDRAKALVAAGCDVLVLDIAHGHLEIAIKTMHKLRSLLPTQEIIAGNVATYEGARDLVAAGASAIKVGVGPGSMCTTRIVTGCGVPQITAIMDAVRFCAKKKVPVIADGGIKNSGDIVKALAAGASTVMLGGLLAGTEEAPGITIIRNGQKFKLTRGMASLKANMDKSLKENKDSMDLFSDYTAEGVEALVPYRGRVSELVTQLVNGLRSGMSYCGAESVTRLWDNAEFVQITNSGLRENHPHDVKVY